MTGLERVKASSPIVVPPPIGGDSRRARSYHRPIPAVRWEKDPEESSTILHAFVKNWGFFLSWVCAWRPPFLLSLAYILLRETACGPGIVW